MGSEIWSCEDIRNILLAIYAAKILPEPDTEGGPMAAEERFYLWGCRVATQALMLAFGLPLEQLDRITHQPPSSRRGRRTASSTDQWWLEDIENIVAAVYRSAISAQACQEPSPQTDRYYQGIGEVISALLQALGSRQDPRRWLRQASADRFWQEKLEPAKSPRLIGGKTEPSC